MTFSENDQEDSFLRFTSTNRRINAHNKNNNHTTTNTTPTASATANMNSTTNLKKKRSSYSSATGVPPPPHHRPPSPATAQLPEVNTHSNSNEFSWPILLAIVPTLGTFFAGSAEIWSDFVMILLILYYVYKWMTVPWSYYESARSRRLIHFNATYNNGNNNNSNSNNNSKEATSSAAWLRQQQVANELRRHELMGLIWVLASPAVAGYTLQYSRYFLSDYERYMSSFNVAVFVLAASLKPLSHVMLLLRERTMYLQSEMQVNETQVQRLQKKLDIMEDELYSLRQAFATKKDLGQVTDGLSPTIQQLTKAIRRFEKKEHLLRSWSEDKFSLLDEKVREFDQFICYKIDQDQRLTKGSTIATLVLLPLNITVWIAKSMTGLLPVPRALLGAAPISSYSSSSSATALNGKASLDLPPLPSTSSSTHYHNPLMHEISSSSSLRGKSSSSSLSAGKHLTHPDLLSSPTTPDPSTVVY